MNRLVKWSLVLVLVLLLTPTALANVTLRALMEDVPETRIIEQLLPDPFPEQ